MHGRNKLHENAEAYAERETGRPEYDAKLGDWRSSKVKSTIKVVESKGKEMKTCIGVSWPAKIHR